MESLGLSLEDTVQYSTVQYGTVQQKYLRCQVNSLSVATRQRGRLLLTGV